jgi:hypothetical protein
LSDGSDAIKATNGRLYYCHAAMHSEYGGLNLPDMPIAFSCILLNRFETRLIGKRQSDLLAIGFREEPDNEGILVAGCACCRHSGGISWSMIRPLPRTAA